MAIYSVANRTTNTTTGNACLEVIASANTAYTMLELGLMINAATATALGFGSPGAKGVTPTSPVTLLAEDLGNTSTGLTTTALAWGTGPTIPTNYYRRCTLPGTIGAGVIWTFPRGIRVLKNTSLILWNLSTTSAFDVWVVVDE